MANSRVRTVNPIFDIPAEVGDLEYANDPYGLGIDFFQDFLDDEYGEDVILESDDYLVDEGEGHFYELPEVPQNITIVEEIIRTQPNGMQVVDLVVEVEEVPGAVRYEFRVVAA